MTNLRPWVAVVDDEESVRRALLRLMCSAGIEARTFISGSEFINSLEPSGTPYCVVLDLHMPGMSGFDVQSWLAENSPDVKVIVVTGRHSMEVQEHAMLTKPIAYLGKPMDDELLLSAIKLASTQGWSLTRPAIPFW